MFLYRTTAVLNIGLRFDIGDRPNAGRITAAAALHELRRNAAGFIEVLSFDVHQSNTEETLVVQLTVPISYGDLYRLSQSLWQDCIAQYDIVLREGELIGPQAAKWGKFNPCFFLLPNGEPLQPHLTQCPEGVYTGQSFANPQWLPLDPNTADFSDHNDCVLLASLGVFHTDADWFKAKREAEAADRELLDAAYAACGLDRRAEYAKIAGNCIPDIPAGVWPQSTGLYAARRGAFDRLVLATARFHNLIEE